MTDRQDEDDWTPPERDHYQEWADAELVRDWQAADPAAAEGFRLPGVCLSGSDAPLRVAKG